MRVLFWTAAVLLAAPLLMVAAASVADAPLAGLPRGGWTLRWYAAALADSAVRDAFGRSVLLAAGSGLLALLAGGWTALALRGLRRRVQVALWSVVLLPLLMPGIVHALALRLSMSAVGIPPGVGAVLLGHAIHGTPLCALLVASRRATLPPALLDAARDLGARPAACFALVVLPWLRPALWAAGALAALASFDDFVRSFFLGGYDPTLPVLLFARMRGGLDGGTAATAMTAVAVAAAAGLLAARAVRTR